MWILTLFIGVFCGMVITALLTGCGRADDEMEISYWRNQYFELKNRDRSDVL